MYIDKEKYLEKKDNILKFLKEHRYLYDDRDYEMIISIISFDILLDNEGYSANCDIAALLSKYNIFTEGNDRYLMFYKMLEELDFIKGNSLEIGSGPYPRLAEIIKDNHKRKDYNLTIYEKCDVFKTSKDIKIIKDAFTSSTNIENIDNIFSIMPCDASIDITLKGIKENKNLLIAYCSCDHSNKIYPKYRKRYWADNFCHTMKKRYGNLIEITEWEPLKEEKMPILIYRKRVSR